ncbi:MAG: LicD family protein [Eubacterium sp.]|nr:LicD family protein [Eubacterium sp.]
MNADQKKLLSLAKEINEICIANDIIYYLAGGSLIGALRHDGFIPWDDDLDILMTKKNWDKFVEVAKNGGFPEGRSLQCQMLDRNYPNVVGRYTDITTTTIHANEMLGYGEPGYVIDVLILDPMPGRGAEYRKYTEDLLLYSDLVNPLTIYSYRYGYNRKRYKKYVDRIKREGKEKVISELEHELGQYKEEECDYYALRWGGVPLLSEKKIYGTGAPRWVDFEDGKFMAPVRAADYLTWHYGDEWMKVPPHVEQVKHDAVFSLSIDYKTILDDYLPEIDVEKEYKYFQKKKEEIMVIADKRQEKKYLDVKVSGEVVRLDTIERIKRFEQEETDLFSAVKNFEYEKLNRLFENYKYHQFSRRFSGREDYGGITRFLNPIFIDIGMYNFEILADVLIHTNQVSLACRLFELIEKCSSEDMTDFISEKRQLISEIREIYSSYDLENHEKTLTKCRELYTKDPFIDSVSMLYIRLLLEKKDYETARDIITKMKEVFPGNKIYDKYRADLVYDQGDHWAAYKLYAAEIEKINDGLVLLDIRHKLAKDKKEIQAVLQSEDSKEAIRVFYKLNPDDIELITKFYLLKIEETGEISMEERQALRNELWELMKTYNNDRRLIPAFIAYYMKFDKDTFLAAELEAKMQFAENYQEMETELQRVMNLPADVDPVEKLLLQGEVNRRMGMTGEARSLFLDAVKFDMERKLASANEDLDSLYTTKQYSRILEISSLFLKKQFSEFYLGAGYLMEMADKDIQYIESSLIRSGYLFYGEQLLNIIQTKRPMIYQSLSGDRKLLSLQLKAAEDKKTDTLLSGMDKHKRGVLIKEYPDSNIILENYINLLIRNKKFQKAEANVKKAEKIYPCNLIYRKLKGDILWEKQQRENAYDVYASIISDGAELCAVDKILIEEPIYEIKKRLALEGIGKKIDSLETLGKVLNLSFSRDSLEKHIRIIKTEGDRLLKKSEKAADILGKLYSMAGEPDWKAVYHGRIETAVTHKEYVRAKREMLSDQRTSGKNIAFMNYPQKEEFPKVDWVKEVQDRALTLLNEVDEICVKHNIEHFIGPKALAQANRFMGYTDQPYMLDMMIPAGRLGDFVKAFSKEKKDDRALEYMGNNPEYPYYQLSYVDKCSISFIPEIEKSFKNHGIRVAVIPIRNRPAGLLSLTSRMLETGWENNHYKIEYKPNKNKAYAENVIRKIQNVQPEKMSGYIFKVLERIYRYTETDEHLIKYPQKNWVNFFDFSFKKISIVYFDGYPFPAPGNVDEFLYMVTGKNGIPSAEKAKAHRDIWMYSVLVTEPEWIETCSKNDDCLNKLWTLQQNEYDIRKLLKGRELHKENVFLHAKRSRDRMELYEELSAKDKIIDNLYREKDFESLRQIFRRSRLRTIYYLNRGLGLCVCKKYFDIQCELLELEGKEEKVKELRKLIPVRHMEALKAAK